MKPDYGIDAPGVVRNLLLASAAGLVAWLTTKAGLWSGVLAIPLGGTRLLFPLGRIGVSAFAMCGAMAAWMLWGSKVEKLREREWLLDRIAWSGSERVLDVGCGRGLMLVAAARRLTTGRATGIDIWQSEDLSGNRPEAALVNAECEGVRDRVDVQTADMRKIPFPDATFDVIVSCSAVHNLYQAKDRRQAIGEIARVLTPGGHALIDDISHGDEYVAAFAAHGCTALHVESKAGSLLAAILTMGRLRQVKLVARKAPAA